MALNTMKLRPGKLVVCSAKVEGGVSYHRVDLDSEQTEDGTEVKRWNTTRTIDSKEEFDGATKIAGIARGMVYGCCIRTQLGRLCPNARNDELSSQVEAARSIVDQWNKSATRSFVSFYVMRGEIATDDVESARAITAELADLMEKMERAIASANVEEVRKNADKARQLGAMLDEAQADRVGAAVKAARKAANTIAKRVDREGEAAAEVIATLYAQSKQLNDARFAFLDFDGTDEPTEDAALPAVDQARFAELEV